MRDSVTLYQHLSLAGHKPRISPVPGALPTGCNMDHIWKHSDPKQTLSLNDLKVALIQKVKVMLPAAWWQQVGMMDRLMDRVMDRRTWGQDASQGSEDTSHKDMALVIKLSFGDTLHNRACCMLWLGLNPWSVSEISLASLNNTNRSMKWYWNHWQAKELNSLAPERYRVI